LEGLAEADVAWIEAFAGEFADASPLTQLRAVRRLPMWDRDADRASHGSTRSSGRPSCSFKPGIG